ncbi:MAG: DUF2490 domain-containing protein [Bacteroidaceae bacterium]|nr:DUF2490 domain-containing protein [Bacteroidaceae bacterium]
MKTRVYVFLLAAVALLLPSNVMAEGDDDFGMWFELGAEKALPKNFSVSLEGGLRTQDNAYNLDRLHIGVGLNYKLNKYLKFGTSYMFMGSYSPEKKKERNNGYNLDEAYMTPRHRVNVEVTGGYKIAGWVKVSVRERYQYTYGYEESYTQHKYRFKSTGELKSYTTEIDKKEEENSHVLRSRLKIEMARKGINWNPFVSVEFHNNLSNGMNMDKLRTCIGTEYKFNKKHSVGLAYVLTHKFKETETNRMHAVCASLNFGF